MNDRDTLKAIQLLLGYSNGQPAEAVLSQIAALMDKWQAQRMSMPKLELDEEASRLRGHNLYKVIV